MAVRTVFQVDIDFVSPSEDVEGLIDEEVERLLEELGEENWANDDLSSTAVYNHSVFRVDIFKEENAIKFNDDLAKFIKDNGGYLIGE